ncbi:hypothetical protein LBMAG53_21660 [Planctomycetota bacterium]|nr:hypothetical protein LBMAG53_21660 [Planctomycetota bacterium]
MRALLLSALILATAVAADPPPIWTPVADLPSAISMPSATVLNDGRVLVAGTSSAVSYLYQPADNTWSIGPNLLGPVEALADGRIVSEGIDVPVLFDPATGMSQTTTGMPDRLFAGRGPIHRLIRLADGRIAASIDSYQYYQPGVSNPIRIGLLNPATASWQMHAIPQAVQFTEQYRAMDLAATPDGRIFIGGGELQPTVFPFSPDLLNRGLFFDLATTNWSASQTCLAWSTITSTPTGILIVGGETHTNQYAENRPAPRSRHTTTALADGRFLVAGGRVLGGSGTLFDIVYGTTSTEFRDQSGVTVAGPPLNAARYQHAAVTLHDGRVMVIGGQYRSSLFGTDSALRSCEVIRLNAPLATLTADPAAPLGEHVVLRGNVLAPVTVTSINWGSASAPPGATPSITTSSIPGMTGIAVLPAIGSYNLTAAFTHAQGVSLASRTVDRGHLTATPGQSITLASQLRDQFGDPMTGTITWTTNGGGTITPDGVFTAGGIDGNFLLTAHAGELTDQVVVIVHNEAPTIAQQITFAGDPRTNHGTLSVLGADDGGESALNYTWSLVSGPGDSSVAFDPNGVNSAKSTTLTVSQQGTYVVAVDIRDAQGLSVHQERTCAIVAMPVRGIIAPAHPSVSLLNSVTFSTTWFDQFDQQIAATDGWSVSGGGSIAADGMFTATGPEGTYKIENRLNASVVATASVTVTPFNHPPTFTPGSPPTVLEDAGPQTIMGWATAIDAGDQGQTVAFTVTVTANSALFSAAPSLSPSGNLTFTSAPDAIGAATVLITAIDSGGAVSTAATTSITITPVNDSPSFHVPTNLTVSSVTGTLSINLAEGITAGPGEIGQTVTFTVVATNPELYLTQPALSPAGLLTMTPVVGATGESDLTMVAHDTGGTENGGSDSSPPLTTRITWSAEHTKVSFASATASVVEGSPIPVTIRISPTVSVPTDCVMESFGTARSSGILSAAPPTTVTIPANADSITFSIPTAGNQLWQPEPPFLTLALVNATNAEVDRDHSQFTATIRDDDLPGVWLTRSGSPVDSTLSLLEGIASQPYVLEVGLNQPFSTSVPVTVRWRLAQTGKARLAWTPTGSDAAGSWAETTIPAGSRSAYLPIAIVGDDVDDADGLTTHATVVILSAVNAIVGAAVGSQSVAITVTDDDVTQPPTVTVSPVSGIYDIRGPGQTITMSASPSNAIIYYAKGGLADTVEDPSPTAGNRYQGGFSLTADTKLKVRAVVTSGNGDLVLGEVHVYRYTVITDGSHTVIGQPAGGAAIESAISPWCVEISGSPIGTIWVKKLDAQGHPTGETVQAQQFGDSARYWANIELPDNGSPATFGIFAGSNASPLRTVSAKWKVTELSSIASPKALRVGDALRLSDPSAAVGSEHAYTLTYGGDSTGQSVQLGRTASIFRLGSLTGHYVLAPVGELAALPDSAAPASAPSATEFWVIGSPFRITKNAAVQETDVQMDWDTLARDGLIIRVGRKLTTDFVERFPNSQGTNTYTEYYLIIDTDGNRMSTQRNNVIDFPYPGVFRLAVIQSTSGSHNGESYTTKVTVSQAMVTVVEPLPSDGRKIVQAMKGQARAIILKNDPSDLPSSMLGSGFQLSDAANAADINVSGVSLDADGKIRAQLTTNRVGRPPLVARLGSDGPVLDVLPVSSFDIDMRVATEGSVGIPIQWNNSTIESAISWIVQRPAVSHVRIAVKVDDSFRLDGNPKNPRIGNNLIDPMVPLSADQPDAAMLYPWAFDDTARMVVMPWRYYFNKGASNWSAHQLICNALPDDLQVSEVPLYGGAAFTPIIYPAPQLTTTYVRGTVEAWNRSQNGASSESPILENGKTKTLPLPNPLTTEWGAFFGARNMGQAECNGKNFGYLYQTRFINPDLGQAAYLLDGLDFQLYEVARIDSGISGDQRQFTYHYGHDALPEKFDLRYVPDDGGLSANCSGEGFLSNNYRPEISHTWSLHDSPTCKIGTGIFFAMYRYRAFDTFWPAPPIEPILGDGHYDIWSIGVELKSKNTMLWEVNLTAVDINPSTQSIPSGFPLSDDKLKVLCIPTVKNANGKEMKCARPLYEVIYDSSQYFHSLWYNVGADYTCDDAGTQLGLVGIPGIHNLHSRPNPDVYSDNIYSGVSVQGDIYSSVKVTGKQALGWANDYIYFYTYEWRDWSYAQPSAIQDANGVWERRYNRDSLSQGLEFNFFSYAGEDESQLGSGTGHPVTITRDTNLLCLSWTDESGNPPAQRELEFANGTANAPDQGLRSSQFDNGIRNRSSQYHYSPSTNGRYGIAQVSAISPGYPKLTYTLAVEGTGGGFPDGASAQTEIIPGHGWLNPVNGNLHLSIPLRSYRTPLAGPDTILSYNSLDISNCGYGNGWRTNWDQRLIAIDRRYYYSSQSHFFCDASGTPVVIPGPRWPGAAVAVYDPRYGSLPPDFKSNERSRLILGDNRLRYFDDRGWLVRMVDDQGNTFTIGRNASTRFAESVTTGSGQALRQVLLKPSDLGLTVTGNADGKKLQTIGRGLVEKGAVNAQWDFQYAEVGGDLNTATITGASDDAFAFDTTGSEPDPDGGSDAGGLPWEIQFTPKLLNPPLSDNTAHRLDTVTFPESRTFTVTPTTNANGAIIGASLTDSHGGTTVYTGDPWTRMVGPDQAVHQRILENRRVVESWIDSVDAEGHPVKLAHRSATYDGNGYPRSETIHFDDTNRPDQTISHLFANQHGFISHRSTTVAALSLSNTKASSTNVVSEEQWTVSGDDSVWTAVKPASSTDEAGNSTTITAYSGNLPRTITDGEQRTITLERDLFGNVTKATITCPGETSGTPVLEVVTWFNNKPELGLPQQVKNARGKITRYDYDSRGRLVMETDPNGGITTAQFDPLDQQTTSTDADGMQIHSSYDIWLRQVGTSFVPGAGSPMPGGSSVSTTALPAIRREYSRDGATWILTDKLHPAVGSDVTIGITVIDDAGRMLRQKKPQLRTVGEAPQDAITEFNYQIGDWVDRITVQGGTYIDSHDSPGNGWPTATVGDLTTRIVRDAQGDVVATTDAFGSTMRTARNGLGWIVALDEPGLTASSRFVSTKTYDPRGLLIIERNPRNGDFSTSYDGIGRLKAQRGPGRGITWTYPSVLSQTMTDQFNQVHRETLSATGVTRQIPGISAPYVTALRDDGVPLKTGFGTDFKRSTTATRTQGGALKQIQRAGTNPVSFALDGFNRTSAAEQQRSTTGPQLAQKLTNSQQFDAYGELQESINALGGKHQVARDATSRLVTGLLNNFLGTSLEFTWKPVAWDARGLVLRDEFVGLGDVALFGREHHYDQLGRLVMSRTTWLTFSYIGQRREYNDRGLVARITHGGRQVARFVHDGLGQVVEQYDANDKLVEKSDYDAYGRLVHCERIGISMTTVNYLDDVNEPVDPENDGTTEIDPADIGGNPISLWGSGLPWRTAIAKALGDSEVLINRYDEFGRMVEPGTADNISVTYAYDPVFGDLERKEYSNGQSESFERDPDTGLLSKITGRDGRVTTILSRDLTGAVTSYKVDKGSESLSKVETVATNPTADNAVIAWQTTTTTYDGSNAGKVDVLVRQFDRGGRLVQIGKPETAAGLAASGSDDDPLTIVYDRQGRIVSRGTKQTFYEGPFATAETLVLPDGSSRSVAIERILEDSRVEGNDRVLADDTGAGQIRGIHATVPSLSGDQLVSRLFGYDDQNRLKGYQVKVGTSGSQTLSDAWDLAYDLGGRKVLETKTSGFASGLTHLVYAGDRLAIEWREGSAVASGSLNRWRWSQTSDQLSEERFTQGPRPEKVVLSSADNGIKLGNPPTSSPPGDPLSGTWTVVSETLKATATGNAVARTSWRNAENQLALADLRVQALILPNRGKVAGFEVLAAGSPIEDRRLVLVERSPDEESTPDQVRLVIAKATSVFTQTGGIDPDAVLAATPWANREGTTPQVTMWRAASRLIAHFGPTPNGMTVQLDLARIETGSTHLVASGTADFGSLTFAELRGHRTLVTNQYDLPSHFPANPDPDADPDAVVGDHQLHQQTTNWWTWNDSAHVWDTGDSEVRSFWYDAAGRLAVVAGQSIGAGGSVTDLPAEFNSYDGLDRLIEVRSATLSKSAAESLGQGLLSTGDLAKKGWHGNAGTVLSITRHTYLAAGTGLSSTEVDVAGVNGSTSRTDYGIDLTVDGGLAGSAMPRWSRTTNNGVTGPTTFYLGHGRTPDLEVSVSGSAGAWSVGNTLATVTDSRQDVIGYIGAFPQGEGTGIGSTGLDYLRRFSYTASGHVSELLRNYSTVNGVMFSPASIPTSGPRFKGGNFTAATGLSHFGARTYSPRLGGRFITRDPAQAGDNWYAYASGDPVNRWDPSGLDWEYVADGGGVVSGWLLNSNTPGGWRYKNGSPTNVPKPNDNVTPAMLGIRGNVFTGADWAADRTSPSSYFTMFDSNDHIAYGPAGDRKLLTLNAAELPGQAELIMDAAQAAVRAGTDTANTTVAIATEPYHQIGDVSRLAVGKYRGIPAQFIERRSMLAGGAQQAVDQNRVASFVATHVALNTAAIVLPGAVNAAGNALERWSISSLENAAIKKGLEQTAARAAMGESAHGAALVPIGPRAGVGPVRPLGDRVNLAPLSTGLADVQPGLTSTTKLFGPYYRSGGKPFKDLMLRGSPIRNTGASDIPTVKGFLGPLPSGEVGYEFYTFTPPTTGGNLPSWPVHWDPTATGVRWYSDSQIGIPIVPIRVFSENSLVLTTP